MLTKGGTIGLCMIARDEAHVIERSLDSVRDLIDYVLVEDTGSTDGTQRVVRRWLDRHGVPGEVIEEAWLDFAFNRTHALERLRTLGTVDYAFVLDADDRVAFDTGFDVAAFKRNMTADFYDVRILHGSIEYHRPQILRADLAFRFRGVLHEFVVSPVEAVRRETCLGLWIEFMGGGDRSRDPAKFQRDAALLERELACETDPFMVSRYTFYLAQSYRDGGEPEKALRLYLARALLGQWQDEVFVSLYNAAQLMEQLGDHEQKVVAAYRQASQAQPSRAEALHGASRFLRLKGRYLEALELARAGLAVPEPSGGLFVEVWIYRYGLLDEVSVSAWWAGYYAESLDAAIALLASEHAPPGERDRYAANARFALGRLSSPAGGLSGNADGVVIA